jgi:hypothetical protein
MTSANRALWKERELSARRGSPTRSRSIRPRARFGRMPRVGPLGVAISIATVLLMLSSGSTVAATPNLQPPRVVWAHNTTVPAGLSSTASSVVCSPCSAGQPWYNPWVNGAGSTGCTNSGSTGGNEYGFFPSSGPSSSGQVGLVQDSQAWWNAGCIVWSGGQNTFTRTNNVGAHGSPDIYVASSGSYYVSGTATVSGVFQVDGVSAFGVTGCNPGNGFGTLTVDFWVQFWDDSTGQEVYDGYVPILSINSQSASCIYIPNIDGEIGGYEQLVQVTWNNHFISQTVGVAYLDPGYYAARERFAVTTSATAANGFYSQLEGDAYMCGTYASFNPSGNPFWPQCSYSNQLSATLDQISIAPYVP